MRQAKLKDFGWSFELRAEAIADPGFNAQLSHHGLDLGGASGRNNRVVDAGLADEDPLPPISTFDARASLIALDHLSGDHLLFDFFGYRFGLSPGALDDLNRRRQTRAPGHPDPWS
jgi:hypothetical protein